MKERTLYGQTVACFCTVSVLLCCGTRVDARQNVVTGEISARYDHQERNYNDPGLVVGSSDATGGEIVATEVGAAASVVGPTVIVLEDRRGDRQRYILTPRLTFSSIGIKDLLELTYAPALNYDHLGETTDLDHDFGLRAERNIIRNWSVSLDNRFFLGDDPVRAQELRTAVIVPETGEPVVEEPAVVAPGDEPEGTLTEQFGRRRYWTNALNLTTDYDYGADRTISAGYTFALLRDDDSGSVGGYTDYDRHTGRLSLDHRWNQKWSAEGEVRYSRGLFDEPDIFVVTPVVEETVQIDQVAGSGSDDLAEYTFRGRAGYNSTPQLQWFAEYSYLKTDYDAEIREDYQVNNVALGVGYDISRRLHVTLSGGPSWRLFENSPTENDYNAYAGVTWDYWHGTLTFFADKGYDQSNFDGRRSGLTDFWRTGITLDYQLTPALTATISATYRDNQRLQYSTPQTIVIVDNGQPAPIDLLPSAALDRIEYTEKDSDAGFSLAYNFLRWYTISGGYRYYDHDSDQVEGGTGSYDEHRAFIQLAVTKELFRW